MLIFGSASLSPLLTRNANSRTSSVSLRSIHRSTEILP